MARTPVSPDTLSERTRIPAKLRGAIRGLSGPELDLRDEPRGWSVRENIHLLVEANLIASNMILATLAVDGYPYARSDSTTSPEASATRDRWRRYSSRKSSTWSTTWMQCGPDVGTYAEGVEG